MTDKTCPFKQGLHFDTRLNGLNVFEIEKKCDRENCQIWVNVIQNRIVQAGQTKFADPDYEYHFQGCGLLQVVPWELVKKEGEKKNG